MNKVAELHGHTLCMTSRDGGQTFFSSPRDLLVYERRRRSVLEAHKRTWRSQDFGGSEVVEPSLEETPRQLSSESLLWAAVIERAVEDACGDTDPADKSAKAYLRRKALAWIASETEQAGSFKWCCHLLGLDSGAVRRRIMPAGACSRARS